MDLPFALPDWLPSWAFLLLAIPALLFVLAFLLMPFSVFGLKARLEAVESQLDTVAEELRNLNFRARGVSGRSFADETEVFDLPNFGRQRAAAPPAYEEDSRAPTLPPPVAPVVAPARGPAVTRLPQRPSRRTEPRLD